MTDQKGPEAVHQRTQAPRESDTQHSVPEPQSPSPRDRRRRQVVPPRRRCPPDRVLPISARGEVVVPPKDLSCRPISNDRGIRCCEDDIGQLTETTAIRILTRDSHGPACTYWVAAHAFLSDGFDY